MNKVEIEQNTETKPEESSYRVVRTIDPVDAIRLIPWFTMKDQTKEQSFLEVLKRMVHDAANTCVCLVVHSGIIKGVSVAYGRQDDAFIWEAHSDKTVPRDVIDEVLAMMVSWAKGMGYNKISGKPNRAAKIWVRRWGFKIKEYEDTTEIYKDI